VNPEIELISNVVDTGDFKALKRSGVTPSLFKNEEAKEVFKWLWEEFHKVEQRGEVPDRGRLGRRFPSFDFCPTRNGIDALVSEIREGQLRYKLERVVDEISEAMTGDEHPTLVLESFLPKLRQLNVEGAEDDGLLLSTSYEDMRNEYDTQQVSGGVIGIPYPWEPLNEATGGMINEQFIVIYGRPKNMKTWVACAVAAHAYENNARVMVFSKEVGREVMRRRIASIIGKVDYRELQRGCMNAADEEAFFEFLEALTEIEDLDESGGHKRALLFVSDKGKRKASTVDSLIATAERFQPDIVIVDGFYLMRDGRSGARTADWKQMTHISQDLKGMAQYLNCPVVGTTQANRANSKTITGDLDDLSFADAIGQDADVAMRCFKGPNPTGRGAAVALVFPGVREAVINPFVINAFPGKDFSVSQRSVNMGDFMRAKQRMEAQETNEPHQGSGPDKLPRKKKKQGDNLFRD
jgi:replicative DNA helicase